MNDYSNTSYLYKNYSTEPEKSTSHIEVLVLTDEETEAIKRERRRMRKEIKAFQIECNNFYCINWYRLLGEKLEEQYNKKGLKRDETWFMSDGYNKAFLRKVDEIFYDEYGFYRSDILKGKTQSWAKTDEISKRIQDYKKGLIPHPVKTSANRRFKKFFTDDGRLILDIDTPEEELTHRQIKQKNDPEFRKQYAERVNKEINEQEKEKIHNQDPKTGKARQIKGVQNVLYHEFRIVRGKVKEPSPWESEKMMRCLLNHGFLSALNDWEIGFNEGRLYRINPKWKDEYEELGENKKDYDLSNDHDYEEKVNDVGTTESEEFPDDNRGDSD